MNSSLEDVDLPEFLTRKERKQKRKEKSNNPPRNGGLQLKQISPKTANQEKIFNQYNNGKHLNITGIAGTGKSFVSLYLALKELMGSQVYEKLIIIRSAVTVRAQGFLPGSLKEKMKVFEAPYEAICAELFGRGDAYSILKQKNIVEFESTSYLRGITLNNCIVILDEAQNASFGELDSVITRLGDNSRLIMCSDFNQTDLRFADEKEGYHEFQKIINTMKEIKDIEMGIDDICRGGLVKAYLIAKSEKWNGSI